MKASKFSDAQKAYILKQADDGVPVTASARTASAFASCATWPVRTPIPSLRGTTLHADPQSFAARGSDRSDTYARTGMLPLPKQAGRASAPPARPDPRSRESRTPAS